YRFRTTVSKPSTSATVRAISERTVGRSLSARTSSVTPTRAPTPESSRAFRRLAPPNRPSKRACLGLRADPVISLPPMEQSSRRTPSNCRTRSILCSSEVLIALVGDLSAASWAPVGRSGGLRLGSSRDREPLRCANGVAFGRAGSFQNTEERIDDRRCELRPAVLPELGLGLAWSERTVVGAVGRHRVPRVGQTDDRSAERNRAAPQAVRIPIAVPALVVVADQGHSVA